MKLYRNESGYPKPNAQANLAGRSHYVDAATLRFHKSRVISARHVDNGLLFAIVTSDALDMDNAQRGFRYAIFDVFGNVLDRPTLGQAFRTRKQCEKAMWDTLNAIDAVTVTLAAIKQKARRDAQELAEFKATVLALGKTKAA